MNEWEQIDNIHSNDTTELLSYRAVSFVLHLFLLSEREPIMLISSSVFLFRDSTEVALHDSQFKKRKRKQSLFISHWLFMQPSVQSLSEASRVSSIKNSLIFGTRALCFKKFWNRSRRPPAPAAATQLQCVIPRGNSDRRLRPLKVLVLATHRPR